MKYVALCWAYCKLPVDAGLSITLFYFAGGHEETKRDLLNLGLKQHKHIPKIALVQVYNFERIAKARIPKSVFCCRPCQ